MHGAEVLRERPIEGDVLSDPGSLIRIFEGIRAGQYSQESYFEWVKAQALKVRQEQDRKNMSPEFSDVEDDFPTGHVETRDGEADEEGRAIEVSMRNEMPFRGYTYDSVTFYFVDDVFSFAIATSTQRDGTDPEKFTSQKQHYIGFGENKAVYNFSATHSEHGEVDLG